MAPVLGGFAGNYNRRHRRSGYVFQNRFKSILCDENSYLLELIRYIHLNPIRAKVVENLSDLSQYPWTGHAGILGRHGQEWHLIEEVLLLFGRSRHKAQQRYVDFMEAGILDSATKNLSGGGLVRSYGGWESICRYRKEHLLCIGDERILGESSFVEQVLEADEIEIELKSRLARDGWNLEKLIAHVCRRSCVRQAELLARSRNGSVSEAKAIICYLGVEKLGLKSRELADRLRISQPAVSKWISKGRESDKENNWSEIFS